MHYGLYDHNASRSRFGDDDILVAKASKHVTVHFHARSLSGLLNSWPLTAMPLESGTHTWRIDMDSTPKSYRNCTG